MKKLIACIALALAGSANATILTSTAAPALAGAKVETFNGVASGTYATLQLADLKIKGNGGVMAVDSTWTAQFAKSGQSLHNNNATPSSFDLVFNDTVTAFGIFAGAVNNSWTYSAYGANNQLLESITTSAICCGPIFTGISNSIGIKRVTLAGGGDWAIFDDLYYTVKKADVPEPGSVALFGLAALGLAATRKRKAS
ncbi:MAG: PEP-CTERM sorting domain-containing protein [Gammaproteobacteria bacterium]